MTPRRRRRAGRPARPRALPRLPILAVLAVALVSLAAGWWALSSPPRPPHAPPARVVLRKGEGVLAIGRDLERAGAVRSGLVFAAVAEATGWAQRLKAGEYAFAPGAGLIAVLRALRLGLVVRHFVTVPEGLTSRDAAAILGRSPFLAGSAPIAPEGALLPETYEVRLGESRAEVILRMERAQGALLAKLWAGRSRRLPYRSPRDAAILASIIEKETALADERARVAAVFVNRLEAGMRLESDPTVIYGLSGGEPLGRGLTRGDLASPSPYNTYRISGLPPTPIDNPGRASLTAALAPAPTADLYFVANGLGGHAFSADLADHLRNVARWRRIERIDLGPAK